MGASISNVKSYKDLEKLSSALREDEPFFFLSRAAGEVLVFLAESADARCVLDAYVKAWMLVNQKKQETAESLLVRFERAGWCIDRLAMQTEGFAYVGEK